VLRPATGGWRESRDERTASMSVLTLTAQAMQGDRERFPGRGVDSYLSKPVNLVKLVHSVRQQCPDVGREGPLPARPALALAHPGALAGLPSRGDGRP
jgi:CheY-like chemotaxis protein